MSNLEQIQLFGEKQIRTAWNDAGEKWINQRLQGKKERKKLTDERKRISDIADKSNRETAYLRPFEHQQIDISLRDLRAWQLHYDGLGMAEYQAIEVFLKLC